MSDRVVKDPVAVLGLGRFGRSCAESLTVNGVEVLAGDRDPAAVKAMAPFVTLAVEVDVTDVHALERLGLAEYRRAVVGVGVSVEGSVLAVSALADLGVPGIWAKALSAEHARILTRLGATVVVFPEVDAGRRVAHQLAFGVEGQLVTTVDGYGYTITPVPASLFRRTLADHDPFAAHGVRVLGVRRGGIGLPERVADDTRFQSGDSLVVCGPADSIELLGQG